VPKLTNLAMKFHLFLQQGHNLLVGLIQLPLRCSSIIFDQVATLGSFSLLVAFDFEQQFLDLSIFALQLFSDGRKTALFGLVLQKIQLFLLFLKAESEPFVFCFQTADFIFVDSRRTILSSRSVELLLQML
jgi:hypothetical protein